MRNPFKRKRFVYGGLVYALRDTERGAHRGLIKKFKEKLPCADCRKRYPHQVMNFDHRNREEKVANIADLVGRAREKLIEEINKCDLVCRNCHLIRELIRDDEIATKDYIKYRIGKGTKIG